MLRSSSAGNEVPHGCEESKMCPSCFATIAIVVSSAISTVPAAVVVLKLFRHQKIAAQFPKAGDQKEKSK
jgi:hypothetical protein